MAFLDYDGLRRLVAIMDERYTRNRTKDSWLTVQKNVRLGRGETLYPVGSQLTLKHSVYGDIVMDVVSHDTVKKYGDESAHTMTLMAHDCIASLQSGAPEAMYYAESGLVAGTYNFTVSYTTSQWTAGTYQFTLTKDVPTGGQLKIGGTDDWAWKAAITDLPMNVYASPAAAEIYESVSITSGSGGTSLGTTAQELNDISRISYGSSNYKESAIRQLLNSDAAAGSVWTAQTYFDRPPSWAADTAGFLNGCDADFLDAIAAAAIKCAANGYYECPESMGGTVAQNTAYEAADKIFLASAAEVGLTPEIIADGSTLFEFYEGAGDADRIKTLNGAASVWGLRTCSKSSSFVLECVSKSGASTQLAGADNAGIAPCCIIA